MRLDSHQHFWRYQPAEYPWIEPAGPLARDFLPPDLAPHLAAAGLEGCIAVQARQTLEETRWLLALAETHPFIKGVVGWVDLRSPEAGRQLARFAEHPRFVGVRHVVQDEPDDRFLLGADFQRGLALLRAHRLTYDLLIYPRQLPAAIELAARFPGQPFVLDHLAKPPIREGALSPWREQMHALAALPHVCCKVSGLVTEARWHAWQPADFQPWLQIALEAFGPERLLFGSDWPVALLAADYRAAHRIIADFVAPLGRGAEEAILGLNATRFYQL